MKPKLTLADAIRIRVQVRQGKSQRQLAREYNVTPGTIHAIIHRKTHTFSECGQCIRNAVRPAFTPVGRK